MQLDSLEIDDLIDSRIKKQFETLQWVQSPAKHGLLPGQRENCNLKYKGIMSKNRIRPTDERALDFRSTLKDIVKFKRRINRKLGEQCKIST